MAKPQLTGDDLKNAVATIDDWTLSADKTSIDKNFKFKDFTQAFAFMTAAALTAEKMDHHPEWFTLL